MRKTFIFILIIVNILFINSQEDSKLEEYMDSILNGKTHNALDYDDFYMIEDKETAISIAVVYAISIYGEESIIKQKPYNAEFYNGHWIVTGSFPNTGYYAGGGVFEIVLSQKNGEVINITHGK